MTRFDIIEKEINKGVKIDEKSNVLINGWSPNNVRRLIIGADSILIQYFVKGGKYGKLVEVLPLGQSVKEDYEALMKENKYTPILKVLTANRIISSIEEIVFCVKGYPKELRMKDMELGVLGKDTTLANRFVRLHSVYAVDTTIKELFPFIQQSVDSSKLLVDTLKEKASNIPLKMCLEVHTEDWYRGTNLRSRWYSMDKEGGSLHTYFTKLKEQKELEERERKLREIELKKHETLANTKIKSMVLLIDVLLDMIKECDKRVETLSIIDKLEWANNLRMKAIHNTCRRALNSVSKEGDEPLSNQLRRVDMDVLIDIGKTYKVDPTGALEGFKELSIELLTYDDSYKRESNKLSVVEGVEVLQRVILKLLNTELNSLYLALVEYCSKAGIGNVDFYVDYLGLDVSAIKYTRPIVAYCNKQTKKDNSGEVLKAMGCTLVEVDELSLEYKLKTLKYLVNIVTTKA